MFLIDRQHYFVVDENRRRAKAVEHVEWTKRKFPTFFARAVIRDHAEVLEEDVDIRAVSNRARRCWSIDVLQTSLMRARHFTLPENLSRLSIETNDEQFFFRMRIHEEAIARQHGRRVSRRQLCFPDDVLGWSKFRRQTFGFRNAGAVWTTNLRPLTGGGTGHRQ